MCADQNVNLINVIFRLLRAAFERVRGKLQWCNFLDFDMVSPGQDKLVCNILAYLPKNPQSIPCVNGKVRPFQ